MALTAMQPTLLLTRPRLQSERFADRFRAEQLRVPLVIAPLMEIVRLPVALPRGPRVGGVILTSENAAACLPLSIGNPVAWCVGNRTAAAARARGLSVQVAHGDARALVTLLLRRNPRGTLVHFRGRHQAGDVSGDLRRAGIEVEDVVCYDQVPRPLGVEGRGVLSGCAPVLLPLFSGRSAELAGRSCAIAAPLFLAAMSTSVAAAWHGPAPRAVKIAQRPDSESMLHALNRLLVAATAA
jgi:uroporphyrinogen-III synthase